MTAKRLRVAVRVRALSPQGPSQAGPTLVGNYGHFTVDSVDEDGTQESFYADCAAVHTGSLLQVSGLVVLLSPPRQQDLTAQQHRQALGR